MKAADSSTLAPVRTSAGGPSLLEGHAALLVCTLCSGALKHADDAFTCGDCGARFGRQRGIFSFVPAAPCDPILARTRAFYEETPFPNYDDLESIASLRAKANEGGFARLLDDQVPSHARILECGCGTGQLSTFLALKPRTVFGTDVSLSSLRLAEDFRRRNALRRVMFLHMDLFRPAFGPEQFDLVLSMGVLHHTSDPSRGFETLARLVRPGRFLMVGLYHRFGRVLTDLRRVLIRATAGKASGVDPRLRAGSTNDARKDAWLRDQYMHPHETKHTLQEVLEWIQTAGLEFVRSVPSFGVAEPWEGDPQLFVRAPVGSRASRCLSELAYTWRGSQEGGYFIVIARKPGHRIAGA